jgi:capsule polysaccharide export protein KpsE/RkpR
MIWLETIFRLAIGTRVGRIISLCIVGYIAFIGYRWKIKADMRAEQAVAHIRLELATAQADLAAAKAAAASANQIAARLAAAEARNMELSHELQKRPATDACRLDDNSARGLQRIK